MIRFIAHNVQVAQAFASSLTELGRGLNGTPFPLQPEKALKLYEFEGCPYCRRVREVLTTLNLDVEIYPCPKNGTRFRPVVENIGGKTRFPFLIDENTGDQIYESTAIIAHLFKHYSVEKEVPLAYRHYPPVPVMASVGTLMSGLYGMVANIHNKKIPAPEKLLELWGTEASPFARVVRARLTELEIPYILHNVAKERWQDQGLAALRLKPGKYIPLPGGKREKVMQRMGGKIQVPYLEDPNTGVKMFESADITAYLKRQYGGAGV